MQEFAAHQTFVLQLLSCENCKFPKMDSGSRTRSMNCKSAVDRSDVNERTALDLVVTCNKGPARLCYVT